MAWGTGACPQEGDLSTRSNQKSVHTESQRQTSAVRHLNSAGSSLHDSSDAGAGTDLRSRSPTRAVCVPSRAKRPTGGGRGAGVVDADLADYFGSIPHAELLKSVTRRAVDRRVLHLLKIWLECHVEETNK